MFTPVQFGKYYLTDRIAVGGMAEIFKAKLHGVRGFEKAMVVKQILPQYARDKEFIDMFIDEAKIAVSLNHGNIITVYELGKIDGVYFIAMEYVRGKDLAEIIETACARGTPISVDLAVFIAIELCKGLDYAHRRTDERGARLGVVHRDINPSNVMVSMAGEVKITDLGIAKATHKLGSTDTGVVKGTYGYMSPEQLAGQSVDHRTDFFSAGIVLHELLCAQRLFPHPTDLQAMERARQANIPPPSMRNPAVSLQLDAILAKALSREPGDRYNTADAFQLALSRFLFSEGEGATSTTLAAFMRGLFPTESSRYTETGELVGALDAIAATKAEVESELSEFTSAPTRPAKGTPDNETQSYAVRGELAELEQRAKPDSPRGTTDVGEAAAPLEIEGTVTLASVIGGDPAAAISALKATAAAEGSATRGTSTEGSAGSGLQRPSVPPLRMTTPTNGRGDDPAEVFAQMLAGSTSEPSLNQSTELRQPPADNSAPAGSQTPLAIESSTAAGSAATDIQPDSKGAPQKPIGVAPRGPRSDESVMALLMKPPTDGHPPASVPVGPSAQQQVNAKSTGPVNVTPAHPASPGRADNNTASHLLSATVSLFVQGLDSDDADAPSGELDEIPRTIKPTTLGWLLIAVIAASALLFVLYKKTSVFRPNEARDEQSLLSLEDIAAPPSGNDLEPEKAAKKTGTIRLTTVPPQALVFLHVGDTPVNVQRLGVGRTHLLRVEREGYRTTHRRIDPDEVGSSRPIQVSLPPTGAGGELTLPQNTPATGPASEYGKIRVESDPPAASVWLFVGKGGAELANVPANRYYFKALLDGHQVSFLSISPAQLEQNAGLVKETLTLRVDAAATTRGDTPESAQAAETAATTASNGQKAAAKAATRRSTRKTSTTKKRNRKTMRRRSSSRHRKRRRTTRRKSSRSKRKRSLHLPSWAK